MQELVYLLKVPPDQAGLVQEWLLMERAPEFVRVATIAPLSNYGYDETSKASLLGLNERGLVFGDPGRSDIPRAFVPWSNLAYVADGTRLAERQAEVAATEKPGAQPVRMSRIDPR